MEEIGKTNADGSLCEAPYYDLCRLGFFDRKKAKLLIKWRDDLSRNQQIMILKSIYPALNDTSVKILLEEARKNSEKWEFAEMGWGNAMDMVAHAKKRGLDLEIQEVEI